MDRISVFRNTTISNEKKNSGYKKQKRLWHKKSIILHIVKMEDRNKEGY